MKRKWLLFLCSMLAMLLLLMSAIPAAAEQQTGAFELQCLSDQQMAVPGGHIKLHLIYHNVLDKNFDKVWLKVKTDGQLEADPMDGGVWDEASGTLQIQVKDVAAGGAGVVHVNMKVKDTAKLGDITTVGCSVQTDLDGTVTVPNLLVKLGDDFHQPVFNGYPDGLFHPERNLTRAETAAMVARIKGLTDEGTTVFKDVPTDHWAYSYIEKVSKAGYMVGDGNGNFRPDDPITRAEYVALLLRLRGIHPVPLKGFQDTDNTWSAEAVGTAKALNYIDGVTDLLFQPGLAIERRDAAKLMDIALQRGPLVDGQAAVVQHWPDVVKTDPSFGWIEEASLVAHESVDKGISGEQLVRYMPDQTNPM